MTHQATSSGDAPDLSPDRQALGGTKQAKPRGASLSVTSKAAWAVMLVFLPILIQAVFQLKLLVQYIFVRNDATYPEGVTVYALLRAFHTHRIYTQPFDFPWNAQMYGPFLYLTGILCTGIAGGEPTVTTVLMRALSFASYLGTVAIVSYLGWRLEGQRRWVPVVAILGLACTWAMPYASTARGDLPSIFLILAAVAVIDVAEGRSWFYFWAGVLASLSCLTKQNTAPLLLAVLLDRLLAKKYKEAAIFVFGAAAVAAPILGLMEFWNEPFRANYTIVGKAVMDWPSTPHVAIGILAMNEMAVVPLFVALLGVGSRWGSRRYRAILLVIAFGVLSNVAALANTGGSANYFILPWFLCLLLVPAGLQQLEKWSDRSLLVPGSLILLSLFLLIHQKYLLLRQPPADLDASVLGNLTVLSDVPYLELRTLRPQLLDPYFYNQLSQQRQWSDAPIRHGIDSEVYDLVLLTGIDSNSGPAFVVRDFRGTSYWGTEVLQEMMLHYKVLCDMSDHLALVPRGGTSSLRKADIEGIFHESCHAADPRLEVASGSH